MATLAPDLPQRPAAGRARTIGHVLSGLTILFLAMDAAMKLLAVRPVADAMAQLGWPNDAATARALGALLLASTALYAWRRTAFLGAVLLTGYLGGAVATHARIDSPLLTHTLFGVYLGALIWAGLYLRDERLRALLHQPA